LGEMVKLIFVLLLIVLVVIISVNSKRQIPWDWQISQHVSESSDTLVPTIAQSVQSESSEKVSKSPTASETYTQSTSSQFSLQDAAGHTGYTGDTENSTTTAETSEVNNTTGTLLIPLVTNATETTNMTALDIYNELKEVEQAARKYISGGFKISTLNSQSIYSKGYMSDYLANRYEVGYKLYGEGYTIFIKPKYEIPVNVLEELAGKPNIRLDGQSVVYEFWIRAYR
jgi:cytoskeletal protein RodZ